MDERIRKMFYRQITDYQIKLPQESKDPHYFLIPNVKLLTQKDKKRELIAKKALDSIMEYKAVLSR